MQLIDCGRAFFPTMNRPPYFCPACVQPLWFYGNLSGSGVKAPARKRQHRSPRISKKVFDPSQAFASTNRKRSAARRPVPSPRGAADFNPAVLVVDDVVDVTDMIALFLKHAGYDVTTANSAAAALGLAADQQFDLVISDIGMPEMNGYELAETLRAQTD